MIPLSSSKSAPSIGFGGYVPASQALVSAIKITIPGSEPITIKETGGKSREDIINMIPDIAYKIKKSGNLIDNKSNRVESSGKKKLPGQI